MVLELMLPQGIEGTSIDIIVFFLGTMNESFDGVSGIIQHKHHRFKTLPNHGTQLLHRNLQTPIPNNQNHSPLPLKSLISDPQRRTQRRTNTIPNSRPHKLIYTHDIRRKSHVQKSEKRSPRIRNNNIIRFQKLLQTRPEPGMFNLRSRRGSHRWRCWPREFVGIFSFDFFEVEPVYDLSKDRFHGDTRVRSVSDFNLVRVEFNGLRC